MSTPTDPRFAFPGQENYDLQWGVDSDVARQEFEAMLDRRRQLLNEVQTRDRLSRTLQTDLAVPPEEADTIADLMRNRVNQQLFDQRRDIDDAQYQRLLGAARFYGIRDAEGLDPDELMRVIELRRGEMQSTREGEDPSEFDTDMDRLQRTIGAVGIGTAEGLSWIARHIPFAGDALAAVGASQWAERQLGFLSEGFRGDLLEDELKGYNLGKSAGNVFGHVAVGSLTWRALQSVGRIGYIGRIGARLGPIQRGAIMGASTEWLMAGGGDDPIAERAAYVAFGTGFGVLSGTRNIVQAAAISGSAGGVAGAYAAREEGGISAGEGFALGATAGLGAVFGAASLFGRVRRSFPARGQMLDPRRPFPEPDAEDFVRADINRNIQEAEWEFADDVVQQRLLGPGASPEGGAPRPFNAPTPDAPAIGPERQLMSPEAAENFRLRQQLGQVTEQRNLAQRAAETDELTGLGNFRAMQRAIPEAEADPGQFLVAFDGRQFKAVNDAYGHDVGNEALQHFGRSIMQAAEEFGIPARAFRQGGDEFAAIVPVQDAEAFARRVEILSQYDPMPERIRTPVVKIGDQTFEGATIQEAYGEAQRATGRQDLLRLWDTGELEEGFSTTRRPFVNRADAAIISNEGGVIPIRGGVHVPEVPPTAVTTRLDAGVGPTMADADNMLMELKRGFADPRSTGLSTVEAVEEGRNLTKQSIVMNDPDLHMKVAKPRFDDDDVADAIVNNGETIRASAIRTPDGLVVEGQMHIDAYEAAGLGDIYDLDPQNIVEGFVTSTGRFVDRQEAWRIAARTKQLTLPDNPQWDVHGPPAEGELDSMFVGSVPEEGLHSLDLDDTQEALAGEHYKDFRDWALMQINNEAASAGIPAIGWTDDAMSSQLPRLIDSWLAGQGFTPHMKRVLDRVFNDLRVKDFRDLVPEDVAFMDDLAARADAASPPGPLAPRSIEDLAEQKGFSFLAAKGKGGTFLHQRTELEVPVENDEAARAFIQNYNAELPDITPTGAGVVPLEGLRPGGGGPGGSSLPPTWRGGEPQQVSSLVRQGRRTGKELEDFVLEGQQIPPAGGGTGGSGGGRPPGGDDFFDYGPEENPFLLRGGNLRNELARQFATIDPSKRHKLSSLMRFMDGITGNWLMPHEHLAMKITKELEELGVDAMNLWAGFRPIKDGIATAHSEGAPWFQGWEDITSRFKSKHLYEGTAARIEEIPNWNDKLAAMQAAGYSEAEMEAQAMIRPFFDRLWGEANLSGADVNYLFDYIPHVRRNIARNVVDPYSPKGMPPEFQFFAEYARHNGLQFRELDLRTLGTHWIRAWMFQKHIAEHYDVMRTAWQHPEIPDQLRTFVNGWLELVMKGHNAESDIMIQGTRNMLNSLGIPVTDGEVFRMYGGTFANMYRAGLGWRPDVVFRDAIQPLMTAPIVGFDNTAAAYRTFYRGTKAERAAMWEWHKAAGIVESGQVQIPNAEIFERVAVEGANRVPTREELAHLPPEEAERIMREGVPIFDPQMMARRNLARKAAGFMRDLLPRKWRGGIQGTGLDPLLPYTSLGQLNRLLAGEAGRRAGSAALTRFRSGATAGDNALETLWMESGLANFPRAVRQQAERLIAIGDDEAFVRLVAGKVADTQFRYGVREAPKGLRKTIGRMAAMFGTFTQQYAFHMWDGARHAVNNKARMRFLVRHATIMGSVGLAGKTLGWDLSKWLWHNSLAFAGGPLATLGASALGTGMGLVRRVFGEEPTMEQEAATATFFRNMSIRGGLNMVNPYAGAIRTLGLYEQTMRADVTNLPQAVITGQHGLDRDLQEWLDNMQINAAPRPVNAPNATQAAMIPMPPPGTPLMPDTTGLEAHDVYQKNGAWVADSPARDPGGRTRPTHSLSGMQRMRQPGETIEAMEQRVLAQRSFSNDTLPNRTFTGMIPEVRDSVVSMLSAARAEGVDLSLSEGSRSQERQDWLFQSGRSRPGPIITWTLTSNHYGGRAADIAASSPRGYEWVQLNAPRFGLSVMGMMDPGHVSMPGAGTQ